MKVDVWINHGHWFPYCRYQNIGPGRDCLGDKPGTIGYHADLTLAYGIRYYWFSTNCFIGQDVPRWPWKILELFHRDYIVHSIVECGKTVIRGLLGLIGFKRYKGDLTNKLVKVVKLSDGQKIYGFKRFNNGPCGRNTRTDSKALARQISPTILRTLKKNRGYMIVYTHLGKNHDCNNVIAEESQQALRNLSHEYENGEIYVTTTSKLLNYNVIHNYMNWECSIVGPDEIKITIHDIQDPVRGTYLPTLEQLQGITFYIPNHMEARLFIDRQEIYDFQQNPVDYTGKKSVMFPRKFLQYPLKYLQQW
jgi:hypothetical protein